MASLSFVPAEDAELLALAAVVARGDSTIATKAMQDACRMYYAATVREKQHTALRIARAAAALASGKVLVTPSKTSQSETQLPGARHLGATC